MKPCPPELQRRAEAFDRVVTALRQVAALSREDIDVVCSEMRPDAAHLVALAPWRAGHVLNFIAPADDALNAELMSLDAPDVGAG